MPARPTLKVFEVFASIQGEGIRQGEPTLFIRLAGCDRRCSFCDTKYAWTGGRLFSAEEVVAKTRRLRRRYPARWACLTGGEPFMQDIRFLVRLLKKDRLHVQVETNGARYYSLAADWFSVSPKPAAYLVRPEFRRLAKEVKLVVTRDLNLSVIGRMRAAFPSRIPIILQPESNRRWSQQRALRLLRESLAAGFDHVRVSVQLQRILKVR